MLCDICKKNPATIHIQEITGNQKKTLHLCQECAAKKAQEDSSFQAFNLAEVLYNISNTISGSIQQGTSEQKHEEQHRDLSCPVCGWDYEHFRKTGLLGCPDCYKVFYSVLKDALSSMHRGTVHLGKHPEAGAPLSGRKPRRSGKMLKKDVLCLQKELDQAVKQERYEDAAFLRDRINDLKKKAEAMDHETHA